MKIEITGHIIVTPLELLWAVAMRLASVQEDGAVEQII